MTLTLNPRWVSPDDKHGGLHRTARLAVHGVQFHPLDDGAEGVGV